MGLNQFIDLIQDLVIKSYHIWKKVFGMRIDGTPFKITYVYMAKLFPLKSKF